MRVALIPSLLSLALGCDRTKPPTSSTPDSAPLSAPAESLPAPTAKFRISADDLYDFYNRNKSFPAHPQEGQRFMCKTVGFMCFGTQTPAGETLVLEESDKGIRRPRLVFVLRDTRGFKTGTDDTRGDVYFEGVLRGPVECRTKPWAQEWASLGGRTGRWTDHFILIDETIPVAPSN